MTTPLIEDGCVVVEGDRIVSVGAYRDLKPAKVDHDIDGVLMPGLINAHTHLELTNITRPPAPIAFTDWIIQISQQIRGDKETFAARRAEAVRQGIAQCIKFGVTCVGDITQNVDIVRPILREGPIRSVSFGECLGIGERRWRFEELHAKAIDTRHASALLEVGVSPHAPYTVDQHSYWEVVDDARFGYRVSTHLAETPWEAAFLRDHSGPLRDMYARIGTDPGAPVGFEDGPIAWLATFVPKHWLLAHMNYCEDYELGFIVDCGASVVWCPRTHAYFGHPPHRWREMIQRGVTVCVGTDSVASSPDLNVVDDLRLLLRSDDSIPTALLWSLVTTRADRALRWRYDDVLEQSQPIGTLAPGAMADLVSFPTRSGDPLREILETPDMLPAGVWIGGASVAPVCNR